MENSIEIAQKFKKELPYDPAIPYPGIYAKGTNILCQRDMRSHVHNIFMIGKTQKQPKCPSGGLKSYFIYLYINIVYVYIHIYAISIYKSIYLHMCMYRIES